MFLILTLLVAVVSAAAPQTFTPVFSRPSLTSLTVSIANPPATTTILFGWGASSTATFPSDVIICAPGSVSTCLDVTCSSATACAARNPTILTANTVTASSIMVTRPFVGTVTLADGTSQFLLWLTSATAPNTTTLAANAAANQTWNAYQADLPAYTPTTNPTFPVTFSRPSATTMGVSFPTPPAGQTIWYGWRTAETVGWPADVVICAPGSVSTCLDVSCTSASVCATRNPTIYTTNTVTATSINLVRTLSPLVDGGKQWIAYNTAATATGTTTLDATTAQSRSWSYYTADVPAYTPTTVPDFPINITRPTDTTVAVSIPQPPANKTVFFGWRTAETVGWPADVVICAPGSVSTCLDVSCTSASVCATRNPTIYTTNTVTASSVSLARTMASGAAPIVAGKKMWLAYTSSATAAGTTTLDATTAQSKTWSYYSADVPAVSEVKSFVPAVLLAICAVLYVL